MYGFESMTWPQTIPIPMTEEGLSHQDLAALKCVEPFLFCLRIGLIFHGENCWAFYLNQFAYIGPFIHLKVPHCCRRCESQSETRSTIKEYRSLFINRSVIFRHELNYGNCSTLTLSLSTVYMHSYCTVSIGGQKHRTTTQKDTLNPVWNEAFELLVYAPETEVNFHTRIRF